MNDEPPTQRGLPHPGVQTSNRNPNSKEDTVLAKIKTLLFCGGEIHDAKGCGDEIEKILKASGEFEVARIDEDLDAFVAPKLDSYDLLVLYYTIGDLNDAQKNGLLNWIASGRGFVGIHSAADSFKSSPEFIGMIGGVFITHPTYREYQVSVADSAHPITKDLVEFNVTDEQYVTNYDPRVQVLAAGLFKGKAMPVAWTKEWGKGRVYYLALGHDPAACRHEVFAKLLTRGALWAATP